MTSRFEAMKTKRPDTARRKQESEHLVVRCQNYSPP